MNTSLVLTVVAPDRPGLVSAISDTAAEFGANWADSLMANLAGQFAGILHLQVPSGNADMLVKALKAMEGPGMQINVAVSSVVAAPRPATRRIKLELVGQDRPGIIHAISAALAKAGVSIERLQTSLLSGAMSGEQLFQMNAQLSVPLGVTDEKLREALEALANELMVDISLDDPREVG